MRRWLAILAIASALSGCSRKGRAIGGGITLGWGIVVTAAALTDKPSSGDPAKDFGQGIGDGFAAGAGIVAAIVGGILVISALVESPPEPPVVAAAAPPRPVDPELVRDPVDALSIADPVARQFAIQASSAARRGDCAGAKASARRLAAAVYAQLAAADAALAGCMR